MTLYELKQAALREAGLVSHFQAPSAEYGAIAQDRYEGLHATLVNDNVARWAVTEDIPEAVQQALTWSLAFLVAGPLGAPTEEVQRLAALGAYGLSPQTSAERQLRRYAAAKYVSQPATACYY